MMSKEDAIEEARELLDKCEKIFRDEWPTIDGSYACVDCKLLSRVNTSERCPHCGSAEVYPAEIRVKASFVDPSKS